MDHVQVEEKRYRSLSLSKSGANSSFDAEKRTIDVVFATETPVLSRNYNGDRFYEILSCKPEHVRGQRVEDGAAVLDSHQRYGGVNSQIGVTSNLVFSENSLGATLKFSKRKELDGLMEDIKDGITRGVSAGYNVYKYKDISGAEDKIKTFMAVDWEPFEISIEPVQADPNSKTRSKEENKYTEVELINRKMDTTVEPVTPAVIAPVAVAPTVVDSVAERTRSLEIMNATEKASLPITFATEHIKAGTSVEGFRALVIDKLVADGTEVSNQRNQIVVTTDALDKTRSVMEIGLSRKLGIQTDKDFTQAELVASEQYRSMSMLDAARAWMLDSGIGEAGRMGSQELAKRALISSSSSDFPVMLEGIARRVLQKDFAIISDTWSQIANIGSVSDFRDFKRIRGGSIGNLDKVNENGEYKNKAIPDGSGESIRVETYGNTVNVTRKMLINDDLGIFLKLTSQLARASARTIEQAFYNMVNSNGGLGPIMADGLTLFHANHKNIAPAGAFGVPTIPIARDLMGAQMDFSGNDFLDLKMDLLLVPQSLVDTALTINTAEFADEANKFQKKNIYKGAFGEIVSSQRLTSPTRWYAFANKDIEPVFEVAFLNGQRTPYMEQREEFDVDGVRWKIRHDWGMAAVGFKGAVTNAGA